MLITRDNYEIWFLDFAEGRLNDEQQQLLHAFLQKHPDLQTEFQELLAHWDELTLEAPHNGLGSAERANFRMDQLTSIRESDRLLIAELEGDLSEEEKTRLSDLILANSDLLSTRAAFQKTRLAASAQVSLSFGNLVVPDAPDMDDTFMLLAGEVDDSLNHRERSELEKRIAVDASLNIVRMQFAKTRLDPAWQGLSGHVYEDKDKLRREQRAAGLFRLLYPALAAAASLTFLIWLFYHEPSSKDSFAVNNSASTSDNQATPKAGAAIASLDTQKAGEPNNSSVAAKRVSVKKKNGSKPVSTAPKEDKSVAPRSETAYFSEMQPQHATFQEPEILAPFTHLSPRMTEVLGVSNVHSVNDGKQYLSVSEFASRQVKKTLWGSDQYPKEDFVYALAQKGVSKVFPSSKNEGIVIEKIDTQKKKEFKIKIGRFEYSRARR